MSQTQLVEGVTRGQLWTGKSGMGPKIKIRGIDPQTGRIYFERPDDTTDPYGDTSSESFFRSYQPLGVAMLSV